MRHSGINYREILGEALELLRESAKEWGIELETLGSIDDIEEYEGEGCGCEEPSAVPCR